MRNLKSILSLALKPGNEYLRAVLTRLLIFVAAFCVSSIFFVIGISFLVWSSYLYFTTILNPYVAALISGLIALVLAGALVLIVSLLTKSPSFKEQKKSSGDKSRFEDASEIINQYPLESGLMAVAAGFIAGSSPDSRKVLSELFITLSQSSSD